MTDGELPIPDDAPSGGGEPSAIPEGYTSDMMEGGVSPEAYANARPFEQDRFRRYSRRLNEEKTARAQEASRAAALEARLQAVEGSLNKASEPKPEGLAALSDSELRGWKQKALKIQQDAMREPTNEDLRAELAQIQPEHLMAVDDELMTRRARQLAKEAQDVVEGRLSAKERQNSFEQRIAAKYGNQYVLKGTPEYTAAIEEFRMLKDEFDVSNDTAGAYTVMAIERAKAKFDAETRGRRGGDAALRGLAIEGAGRREAHAGNEVAALLAKGDLKSQARATDIQLDAYLKHHSGG